MGAYGLGIRIGGLLLNDADARGLDLAVDGDDDEGLGGLGFRAHGLYDKLDDAEWPR